MTATSLAAFAMVALLAPALPGVAVRTRAFLTGRRGQPALQLYYELAKLLRKRVVVADPTTVPFRLAPLAGVVAALLAAALLPLDGRAGLGSFAGDFLLFAGLLSLERFLVVLAAMDTGSSFEGMGASRAAMVGAFAEGGLLLVFAALVLATGRTALGAMLAAPLVAAWHTAWPSLLMLGVSLFVLLLAEASRVPVDDPATHLELTMIHEVAVLDHSGPDLALLLYGGALKFALFAALVTAVLAPVGAARPALALLALPAGLLLVAVLVGVVEAAMARLRLVRLPQLLLAVSALAFFAALLLLARP